MITSPGAKYDAQGTGGIINIILKDNKMQGINGSINLSAGTRLENGSANLNIRHNNIGVNVFFSGNAQLTSRTPSTQDRSSVDTVTKITNHLIQDTYTGFQRSGYQSGIGFDWSITKHDNITAALSYNHFGNRSEALTNIQQDTLGAIAPIKSNRSSVNQFETNSLDWSLNYRKTFKKENQELDILYNASYGQPTTNYNQTTIYDAAAAPYLGAISNNPGTNKENNISLDYTHPVTDKFIVETGAKTVLTNITSTANVNTLQSVTQEYLPDPGQSYNLKYDMQVYAAYLSASFPMTDFLKVKAGARYEYTATQINNADTNTHPYGTLVPSIILSHDIKNGQFIKLSYTRRIERPDYRDVNPFLNLADPNNITTGNPLLKPEIGNNFELGYNKSFGKNGNVYIALIERINTQDHKNVTTFYPVYQSLDSVFVTNVQNAGHEYNTGVNISGSWSIKDKLSLRGNGFLSQRHFVSERSGINGVTSLRFRLNLNATYQLPHDLVTEVFGNYNSASTNIQGKTPQSITYTFAFRKQFWNKNASFGLTATNIFNEYTRQLTTIQTGNYSSYNVRMLPYRSVGISFMYKFGKLEFKKPKEDDSYLNNPPVMGN
ncbi:MAG: TonB-dependent receptor domain-containing protein [Chitinophagales bacterium]